MTNTSAVYTYISQAGATTLRSINNDLELIGTRFEAANAIKALIAEGLVLQFTNADYPRSSVYTTAKGA
tara:strand:- start:4360 stop:4566 length:207 start_codon:yes stop_codon:yes gene_type:complete